MPAIVKNTSKEKTPGHVVNSEVKSHANDPFVLKKVEKAKETLKNAGLPGQNK
ncbi:hypothetical protein [Mucilaginibacter ginsenosidivorax]|uniref:hypothetical protein n=1 Tax=Mucilaginibacter ginsenosidivorax TaxID=862126 RepID=UPI0018645738|nr:hypothetical protein [Mucilaginibacter ginsenosidivorax]